MQMRVPISGALFFMYHFFFDWVAKYLARLFSVSWCRRVEEGAAVDLHVPFFSFVIIFLRNFVYSELVNYIINENMHIVNIFL